jgi:hypothetical protein
MINFHQGIHFGRQHDFADGAFNQSASPQPLRIWLRTQSNCAAVAASVATREFMVFV